MSFITSVNTAIQYDNIYWYTFIDAKSQNAFAKAEGLSFTNAEIYFV